MEKKRKALVPGELLRYLSQNILKKFFFIYKRTKQQTQSPSVRKIHNVARRQQNITVPHQKASECVRRRQDKQTKWRVNGSSM